MSFDDILHAMNKQGYSWHVFQEYGPNGEERGFSQSFHTRDAAEFYSFKVPGGIVYDKDGNVVEPRNRKR